MFWDTIAGVYDIFEDVYNGKVNKELCQEVAELISADDDVLECACGTGMLTVCVAPQCKSIVATDFSKKMLERASKSAAGMETPDLNSPTSWIWSTLTAVLTK